MLNVFWKSGNLLGWICRHPVALDVLLWCMQVGYRCFYTGAHNKQLYPTFTRAAGRVGSRYTNIFRALCSTFGFTKFVLLEYQRQQATVEMITYIKASLYHQNTRYGIKRINPKLGPRHQLKVIKDEGDEAGACGINASYCVYFSYFHFIIIIIIIYSFIKSVVKRN